MSKITIEHTATGETHGVTTIGPGYFFLPGLMPGMYWVKEEGNFRKTVVMRISRASV